MKTFICEVVPVKNALIKPNTDNGTFVFEQDAHTKVDCRTILSLDSRIEKVVSIKMKKKGK